ncbi:hypothetical protein [Paenibacillus sp. FSL K6-2524]|uniref:hypothetical protein n=1 Tax=Paenibacillus sp. FSL K6-2524 TaxID=2954516 RepID=UPI0030FACC6E
MHTPLIAKKNFNEGYSGPTFNQLSLTTRSLRSLKLIERQGCQPICVITGKDLNHNYIGLSEEK